MKRLMIAATAALLTTAGCATTDTTQQDTEAIAATCKSLISDEYSPEQRPPAVDIASSAHAGDAYTIKGTAKGNAEYAATYTFVCDHEGGDTALSSFEFTPDAETPLEAPTVSTAPNVYDEVANSLSDDEFDTIIGGLESRTAELDCIAAVGEGHVPAGQKPYTHSINAATPHRGGYLISGRIEGSSGLVAQFQCEVDSDRDATVTQFKPM